MAWEENAKAKKTSQESIFKDLFEKFSKSVEKNVLKLTKKTKVSQDNKDIYEKTSVGAYLNPASSRSEKSKTQKTQ